MIMVDFLKMALAVRTLFYVCGGTKPYVKNWPTTCHNLMMLPWHDVGQDCYHWLCKSNLDNKPGDGTSMREFNFLGWSWSLSVIFFTDYFNFATQN
jgi:hypothetical protein